MNIKYLPMDYGLTRAICYADSTEVTDNGDGTYDLVDTAIAETLGQGSEIIITDIPGKLLFVSGSGVITDWTGTSSGDSGGDDDDVPEGYIVIAPKQSVTLTGEEDFGALLTLAPDAELNHGPDWIVKVDNYTLEYDSENDYYTYTDDEATYGVAISGTGVPGEHGLVFWAADMSGDTPAIIPGTYQVSVYAPESDPDDPDVED